MGKAHYRAATRQFDFANGNDINIEIPRQYQAATLTLRVKLSFTGLANDSQINAGGFHNVVKRLQFVVGGNNQLFAAPGIMAAAFACMRRRQNIDDLVVYDGNNSGVSNGSRRFNSETGSIDSTADVVVDFPIDFQHVSGLRPDDTLFQLNRPNETVYLRITPADNIATAAYRDDNSITVPSLASAQAEVIIDQYQSLHTMRPSVPVLARFVRTESTLPLTAANGNDEIRFSSSPFYSAFLLAAVNSQTLRPGPDTNAYSLASRIKSIESYIAQQLYQRWVPADDLYDQARLFGDFTLSTDYSAFFPILFTRRPGSNPDELTDAWMTLDSNDTKLRIDHTADSNVEIRCLAEQMRPLDPPDFIGKITGVPPATIAATAAAA